MSGRVVASGGPVSGASASHDPDAEPARFSPDSRGSRGHRPARSARSSSSASDASGASGAAGGTRAVVTSSGPGAFVDARGLSPDREVGERLGDTGRDAPFIRPKVIGFRARVGEGRRARTIAVLIRAGIVALVLAIVAGLVWLLLFSPVLRFETDGISVVGANEWVSADEVAAVAEPQVGRSLLVVSTEDIARQLKAVPGVTSADAVKNWPHGITITVAAQKPAAVLRAADGSLTAVDSQARVLNAVGASVDGIPVIDVDGVGEGLADRAVQQALQVLASLPESMRQRITKVTAHTQDSITTELDGGNRVVVWGDASELELKKAEVDRIINDPAVIGDRHQVNVSSPRKPIIK